MKNNQQTNKYIDGQIQIQLQDYQAPPPQIIMVPEHTNNQPQQQMNPNIFMVCNQGIANGFGDMFFNIRDPSFTQKNIPIKQQSSYHMATIIVSFILIVAIIVAAVGFMNFLDLGATIALIAGTYLLYAFFSICCSDIRSYVSNMRQIGQYADRYKKIRTGRGFFKFYIECYHYHTIRSNSGTTRMKNVTHTAQQIYTPQISIDESGELQSILQQKQFVFIHYLRRYYFINDASQNAFMSIFNKFVHDNTRDHEQKYYYTFEIEGFEEFTAYSAVGGTKNCVLFYIFTLLGLALPYSCFLQKYISRYDVGILKRLTV